MQGAGEGEEYCDFTGDTGENVDKIGGGLVVVADHHWKDKERIGEVIGYLVVFRIQSDYHEFFVDIGRGKLEVFCINGAQREDSNKNMGLLYLCR